MGRTPRSSRKSGLSEGLADFQLADAPTDSKRISLGPTPEHGPGGAAGEEGDGTAQGDTDVLEGARRLSVGAD